MRRDHEPVDLLVTIVGKREDRPVRSGLARAHLDAADDAVRAGRGGNLDAIAVGALKFDGVGEVDGGGVGADVDGFQCSRRRRAEKRQGDCQDRASTGADVPYVETGGAQECQTTPPRPAAGASAPPQVTGSRNTTYQALCEFPNARSSRICLLALVAVAGQESKNIPVYFQRVSTILPMWPRLPCEHGRRLLGARGRWSSSPAVLCEPRSEAAHAFRRRARSRSYRRRNARSVEPVCVRRLSINRIMSTLARDAAWNAICTMRPSTAAAS